MGDVSVEMKWQGANSRVQKIEVVSSEARAKILALLNVVGGSGNVLRFVADPKGAVYDNGVPVDFVGFIPVTEQIVHVKSLIRN